MKLIFKGGFSKEFDMDVFEVRLTKDKVYISDYSKLVKADKESQRHYWTFDSNSIFESIVPYEYLEAIEL